VPSEQAAPALQASVRRTSVSGTGQPVAGHGRRIGGKVCRDISEDAVELGCGVDGKSLSSGMDLKDERSYCSEEFMTQTCDL
jgi:hypothetical protein